MMPHRSLSLMRVAAAARCHCLQDAVARSLLQRHRTSACGAIAVDTHFLRRYYPRAPSGGSATRSYPPLGLTRLTAASAARPRPSLRLASATATVSILEASGSGHEDESGLLRLSPRWNRDAQSVAQRGMSTMRGSGEGPPSSTTDQRTAEPEVEEKDEKPRPLPSLGKGQDLMSDDPEARPKAVIAGYDEWGFQMTDGVDVRGSMLALPNSYFLWAPKTFDDITVESLRLVELVQPKIDLLLIGVGEKMMSRLDPALMKHLRSKGIRVEQLDTVNACSTFNVLNAEDRRVAAALLTVSDEQEPQAIDGVDDVADDTVSTSSK